MVELIKRGKAEVRRLLGIRIDLLPIFTNSGWRKYIRERKVMLLIKERAQYT